MAREPVSNHHGPYLDSNYEPFTTEDVRRIVTHVGFALAHAYDEDCLRTDLCRLAKCHQLLVRTATAPSLADDRAYLKSLKRAADRMAQLLPMNELPAGGAPDNFQAEPAFGIWRLLEEPLQVEMQDSLAQERATSLKADDARASQVLLNTGTARRTPPRADLSITLEELFGSASGKDVLAQATRINGLIAAATARALLRIEDPEASKMDATNEQIAVKLMVLYSKAFDRKAGFSRTSDGKNTGGPMIRFVSACCEKMAIHLLPGSIARIKQRSFPKTDV